MTGAAVMLLSLIVVMIVVPWLLRPDAPDGDDAGARRSLPARLETDRLVLRLWETSDAPELKRALDLSLDHLHPWVPWARQEPFPLDFVLDRIRSLRADFDSGDGFEYGIFVASEAELVGSAGLYARVGPGAIELGYWLRADRVGHGYATEAARALTELAFGTPDIDRVVMHIDPRNGPSLAIAERLAFREAGLLGAKRARAQGDAPDTLVFEQTRAEFAARGGPSDP